MQKSGAKCPAQLARDTRLYGSEPPYLSTLQRFDFLPLMLINRTQRLQIGTDHPVNQHARNHRLRINSNRSQLSNRDAVSYDQHQIAIALFGIFIGLWFRLGVIEEFEGIEHLSLSDLRPSRR